MSRLPKRRNKLSRRNFVGALGAATGYALVPVVGVEKAYAVAADYVRRPASRQGPGLFFNAAQLGVLRAVCDQVIPRTDTPGAVDTDVHGFLDNQILHCHSDVEQRGAKRAIDAIERFSRIRFQQSFQDLSGDDQLTLLTDIESRSLLLDDAEFDGFRFVKSMIVFGYCTSEAGATRALAFDPYPGRFTGSVPYADIGRAWYKG